MKHKRLGLQMLNDLSRIEMFVTRIETVGQQPETTAELDKTITHLENALIAYENDNGHAGRLDETMGRMMLKRYMIRTGLAQMFPKSSEYIGIEPVIPGGSFMESHFRYMSLINQLVSIALQLQNDMRLPNHKYMAHQVALLYQCINQAGPQFSKYKPLIEEHFNAVKELGNQSETPCLPQNLQTWLSELTTDIVAEALYSGRPMSQTPDAAHLSDYINRREIFAELAAEDALLIMARGLGLRSIMSAFIQIYCQAQSLVLLVNTSSDEETALRDTLPFEARQSSHFKSITSELNASERAEIYRCGGVLAITSRILLADILNDVLPTHLVTGLLVANAHRITATSSEAFVIRLYRTRNSDGFLKAFSDNPEAFAGGFSTLEKTMKLLYLRKVNLWPRFHVMVSESLEAHAADVIEIRQPMTKSMKAIQAAIIDCIDACLQEIRRSSSAIEIDVEDFTVEKAMFKSFDVTIRRQLDPIWHRVSHKTKQLVSDLGTLRKLLAYLVSYDCVTFNNFLEAIVASNAPSSGHSFHQHSPWLFTDPADKIFSTARARVFLKQADYVDPDDPSLPPGMRPILEEQPKWSVLSDIMDEIEMECYHEPHPEGQDAILIMVEDQRTCNQLKMYLASNKSSSSSRGKPLLRELLHGYLRWKSDMKHVRQNLMGSKTTNHVTAPVSQGGQSLTRGQPPNKRRRVRGGATVVASAASTSLKPAFDQEAEAMASFIESHREDFMQATGDFAEKEDDDDPLSPHFGLIEPSTLVIVRPYHGEEDAQLLDHIKPRFIIMYDPNPSFVRSVEVYKACHPGKQIRVYFTVYDNSVEEQLYLSALRREKDSFSKLIRDKSIMVLPIGDIQSKQVRDQSLLRNIHTRIAGGGKLTNEVKVPQIVVDIRELRSSLPSILDAQGFTVIPCTITVGDYVLSPNVCVERKSISDLISSLSSGRLYTQAEAMTAHYSQSVLLIEFDEDKSFALQTASEVRPDISITDISSKLVLLTLAFPTLRVIWSSSVHATVEIFEDLKRSEDEPDMVAAQAIGVDQQQGIDSDFNLVPQDMLRCLPGITSKNYRQVMRKVGSIGELAEMDLEGLRGLLADAGAAESLYEFLHRDTRLDIVKRK
ncbi:hypothetical protein DFQ26_001598 [Actinomortierella ambigua]|nr:hypothetical protein DFQ26_001598 [Actinomortierella ambigua]